ncbi:MAG: purine-nucleoside phosphorylase [Bacteroidales bacterium]|nr:purine-nucleoside phosphorylase [Bacteroidales bacterium]
MSQAFDSISASAQYIKDILQGGGLEPKVGIILGSGLGNVAGMIEHPVTVPYSDIPGFPISTAIGHKSNFIIGTLGGRQVIAMQGRFHCYEGYSMDQIVLPVRVMKLLGVTTLMVSNAAGGMNPEFSVGDLMIIRDHINLLPNPLIGRNLDEFGPRFPDMTRPYDPGLIALAKETAAEMGLTLREGVYVSCTGPSYETPAEYKYFRSIGGDAVGMSTTPEVIAARHSGIRVFGMSAITDIAREEDLSDDYVTDGEEIVKAAQAMSENMSALFVGMLAKMEV